MKVSRRDFFKLATAGLATLAVPKAITNLEVPSKSTAAIPDTIEGGYLLPPEYSEMLIALANQSTMRLDYFGVNVSGLEDIKEPEEWKKEAVKRFRDRVRSG